MFYPVRCLIAVFSGSCLACCSYLVRGEGPGCFVFSLVCVLCTGCLGLFALSLSVIGRI